VKALLFLQKKKKKKRRFIAGAGTCLATARVKQKFFVLFFKRERLLSSSIRYADKQACPIDATAPENSCIFT